MTQSLVIDASFAFHLVVPGPRQSDLRALVTEWKKQGVTLIAPDLWLYEITSALCKTVHFEALEPAEARAALSLLLQLGVETIPPDESQVALAFDWTARLSRAAAYDSFYLALAQTLNCELWTMDKHLPGAVDLPWVRQAAV